MSDYVTLLGSETVERAANTMTRAAEEMRRAASTIEAACERLSRILDEHANRIENAAQPDLAMSGDDLIADIGSASYERAKRIAMEKRIQS